MWYRERVANPTPVATVKTGRVRMRLWLVARRDRSWLWRAVLNLQRAPGVRNDVVAMWPILRQEFWHIKLAISHRLAVSPLQQQKHYLQDGALTKMCMIFGFIFVINLINTDLTDVVATKQRWNLPKVIMHIGSGVLKTWAVVASRFFGPPVSFAISW